MRFPTLNHVFYIPLILALGAVIGYWWGSRNVMLRLAEEERAKRQREERRAARRARLADTDSSADSSPAASYAPDDTDS